MRAIQKTPNRFGEKDGSFLVESIVALSLAVVGILGIVVLLTRSLGLTSNVSQRAVATYLAAEGIEVTKNIIDAAIAKGDGWVAAFSGIPSVFEVEYDSDSASLVELSGIAWPLRFDSANGTYSYQPRGQETPFRRVMTVAADDASSTVNAVVTWTVRGTKETLNLEDHFWNWRQ
ncbi:MAG: hypothetical protein V1656_00900 [Candidatus Jorgensenbacteria bacterium]